MKYPAYPKYKPSGVEWLGEVPEHWVINAIWHQFLLGRGRVISHIDIAEDPGEYPVYSSQTENNGILGYLGSYDFEGDYITWTTDGANAGTVFRRTGKFNCTNVCGTLKPKFSEKIDNRFVTYSLGLATGEFVRHDINPKLMNNVMAKIRIGIPSVPEQRAIADFLDREAAKLDTLVAKKRALIEKLKEKRTALISRTVTRGLPPEAARAAGLDPNPKLKPSGIEWLGEVPEHWEVVQLFRIAPTIQTGPFGSQLHQSDYIDGGVPLINPSHLIDGGIVPDDQDTVTGETVGRLARHILMVNDVVFARRGEIGRCAVVGEKEAGWLCGTGSMVVRLKDCEARYFARVFRSAGFSALLTLNAIGTTMLNLNPAIVGRMRVPFPSLSEQRALADYLDRETAKIDQMAAKVEEAITRLQEYRTALITAAVTGKIDVREYKDAAGVPHQSRG